MAETKEKIYLEKKKTFMIVLGQKLAFELFVWIVLGQKFSNFDLKKRFQICFQITINKTIVFQKLITKNIFQLKKDRNTVLARDLQKDFW